MSLRLLQEQINSICIEHPEWLDLPMYGGCHNWTDFDAIDAIDINGYHCDKEGFSDKLFFVNNQNIGRPGDADCHGDINVVLIGA